MSQPVHQRSLRHPDAIKGQEVLQIHLRSLHHPLLCVGSSCEEVCLVITLKIIYYLSFFGLILNAAAIDLGTVSLGRFEGTFI
jgi:hypothetical protein